MSQIVRLGATTHAQLITGPGLITIKILCSSSLDVRETMAIFSTLFLVPLSFCSILWALGKAMFMEFRVQLLAASLFPLET